MGRNRQNFDFSAYGTVQNAVRKTCNPPSTDVWRMFNCKALWCCANLNHGRFKCGQVAATQTALAGLIERDMLKMLDPRIRVKEIAHRRSACPSCRTCSAGMR